MPQTLLLNDPNEAARILRDGGIVAIPTETVFGLAARFDIPAAVDAIFKAKGRPSDNPLIVHLGSSEWLPQVASNVPIVAQKLLEHFAPGPLTVTVPRAPSVSDTITAGLASVAIRIPNHELTSAVLEALDIPLVAPSANRSGRPSPTTWQSVHEEMDGLIDGILMGPPTEIGIESTVVDCCSQPPRLLRPGGVSYERLLEVAPDLELYRPDTSDLSNIASPGLRHRHYSPSTRIILVSEVHSVSPERSSALLSITPHPRAKEFAWTRTYLSSESYAADLFEVFRQADRDNLKTLYCEIVPNTGIGRGLMDRLQRAAEH